MNIKWNEITWYSKLSAAILFLGVVPSLTFYIGKEYQKIIFTDYLFSTPVYEKSNTENASFKIKYKTATSTIDGIIYQFEIPSDFVKLPKTQDGSRAKNYDVWANPKTHDTSAGIKLTVSVLSNVQSKADLIKTESNNNTYKGVAGNGNYSELTSGTWKVLNQTPFTNESNNITSDTFFAKSISSSEGTGADIIYSLYTPLKGFPGKVLVLDFGESELDDLPIGQYFERMSSFSKIVESLEILDYK